MLRKLRNSIGELGDVIFQLDDALTSAEAACAPDPHIEASVKRINEMGKRR
jgi:hypothetical protein